MNTIKLQFVALMMLFSYVVSGQGVDSLKFWKNSREIGLNFTPLVSSLVPFNLSKNDPELIGLRYKKYFTKAAFRFSFGADLAESNAINFLHLGLGYEKRHILVGNLCYTSGWMALLEIKDDMNNFITEGGLGVSHFYGFEYHFNEKFFISTEAQLIATFGEFFKIKFQSPVSIFANVRL